MQLKLVTVPLNLIIAELTQPQPTNNQPVEMMHTTSSPISELGHPVTTKGVHFEVVVIITCVVALLLFLVVVAMVILVIIVVKKAKHGKGVMILGNASPIDNPAYILGRSNTGKGCGEGTYLIKYVSKIVCTILIL